MAVFRVERTRDYTVVSNYHLKDMNLSLKAKGLLTMMLSLPDTWNYTTRGLAAICKEGVDAIRSGIQELEKAGYIVRHQLRGGGGRITDTEYVIYERPVGQDGPDAAPPMPDEPCPDAPGAEEPGTEEPGTEEPGTEEPGLDFPSLENPYMAEPCMDGPWVEKPAQLNMNQVNMNQENIDLSRLTEGQVRARGASGAGRVLHDDEVRALREQIRAQIEYGCILTVENREQVDEFVEIMLEVSLSESPTIRIGQGREYPTALVRERFAQINSSHIERILDAILENTRPVRNTKAYLLAALFDAPASKENHYTMRVNSG